MHRLSVRVLTMLTLLLALVGAALAQVTTGIITGTVTDTTGAVIAGASVTAVNKATNASKTVTTNEQGEYEIGPLQPAEYEITVESSGFTKVVQPGVVVNVNSRVGVKFELKPSGTEEVVTVSGETGATIETTNTVVQGVIDNRQVKELPLTGRTFSNLAVLVPGAKPVSAFDPTKARSGTVSIAGSTGRDANVSVDGGDNKDNVVGGLVQNFTTEGIQEFVVQTQSFLPDTGRSAGGSITVVTKSGTNDLHGSFVIFERNDRFNARDQFNPEFDRITGDGPFEKQPFDRQNIAGSLGFPIIKDKFFFFGAAEYTRENISSVISPSAVRELKVLDQFARSGQIPGVPSVAALSNVLTPFRDTQFQLRVDYRFNDKHQLYARYGHQTNKLENDQITQISDVTAAAVTTNEQRSALIADTYTLNPSAVNVFTFQFSKFDNQIGALSDAPYLVFPSVVFGRNPNVPQSTFQNKFQFRDSISVIKGRHSLKFGADFIYVPILAGGFDFSSTAEIDFNMDPSAILAAGLRLSNPDLVDGLGIGDGVSRVDQVNKQLSLYAQDSFRINSKLTLNYGARYDVDYGFYEPKFGSYENNRGLQALRAIGFIPQGKGVPEDDKNNVSPRIGFAYDPTGKGKAVIRASYGLFYDQIFTNVQFFALQQSGPNIYTFVGFDTPYSFGVDPLPKQTGVLKNVPAGGQLRFIDPNITTPYSQQSSINFQYELTKNFVVETQYIHILGLHEFANVDLNPRSGILNPNFAVGTPGSRNPRILNANFAKAGLPTFGRVRMASSISRSRYDGFTIGVNKRYGGDGKFKYQYGFNYTLSRTLAYGGPLLGASRNDFGNTFENPFQLFRPADLGRTGEDARHRVVINGILDMPYGFQVSSIIQAESARPFPVVDGNDINGDGQFNDSVRVDGNGNFIQFNPGDIGKNVGRTLGVNPGRGVPYFQVDLRVTKSIKISERLKAEGYVEFFNLLNRANIGNNFTGDISAAIATGKNTPPRLPVNLKDLQPAGLLGSAFGAGTTVGIPFQMQLGFRISY
ncbi:MAG: TonB-dependent receptor [Acidobacteria bacterium]|nr:TonB-dependent receptor [Acidobacteriota bacterium]